MESRNKEISSVEIKKENIIEAAEDNSTAAFSHENNDENNNKSLFHKIKNSELFTKGLIIIIYIFIFSLAVYIISRFIPTFAEFWTRYPAQAIRFILAKLTGWIPFSLAETVIISAPILALGYIIGSTASTKRDTSNTNFYRWFRPLLSLLLCVITIFFAGFGPAYGRYKLADNLKLEQKEVSCEELFDTAVIVLNSFKNDITQVSFDKQGASVIPYGYDELVDKLNQAYTTYSSNAEYISHFNSNPKPIALSAPMTYTHISGVYTFMTGEANINTNYPNFLLPFTMAHEMAHQRGIAREDEANFVAFLVCISSDDVYIRYSGYTNMLNYLMSAMGNSDIEIYTKFVRNHLPYELKTEFIAYSEFFDKYRDSIASDVSGAVNNTFLQSQGQKEGTKSYGLVVDLAVAYYKK